MTQYKDFRKLDRALKAVLDAGVQGEMMKFDPKTYKPTIILDPIDTLPPYDEVGYGDKDGNFVSRFKDGSGKKAADEFCERAKKLLKQTGGGRVRNCSGAD